MNDNPMRVLVVEPMKEPYAKEIDGSLESMHAIVGGDIEAVPLLDEGAGAEAPLLLVCNEDGKGLGLPMNRALNDERGLPYDIVCGTFFIVGVDGENFASLTDEQIDHFKDKYSREMVITAEIPREPPAQPPKSRKKESHGRGR